MDILMIGCGVSGLTTGVCLQRAGHTVRIWARELPPHTTSNVAAAIWYPYQAYPVPAAYPDGTVVSQRSIRVQTGLQIGDNCE